MKKTMIISGIGGTMLLGFSAMLKILHLPLSGMLFTAGALLLALIFLPAAVVGFMKEGKSVSMKFMFLVMAITVLLLAFTLLFLSVQGEYGKGFYEQQYQQEALMNYQRERNSTEAMVHQYMFSYRDINEIHRRTSDLMAIVTSLEIEMVKMAEGTSGDPLQDPPQLVGSGAAASISYRDLSNPFSTLPSEQVLNPGTGYREELDKAMEGYTGFLKGLLGTEGMEIIGPLLDHSTLLPDGKAGKLSIGLMPALHAVTVLKNRILLAEIASVKILSIPQESE